MKWIFHIDFNSYFATVEQQANPRLRGKPIGVTGGDRTTRTVLGTASVEAKRLGVKGGMTIPEAKRICPEIILVPGDSDKYLATTKKFLNILKDYSPYLEVFSIDEAFLELHADRTCNPESKTKDIGATTRFFANAQNEQSSSATQNDSMQLINIATEIKQRIRSEIGEWITCSIGISYNKVIAKLAGSLYKPDGLVLVEDSEAAMFLLDRLPLDEICGLGPRIKKRLNNMGVFDFPTLRKVPMECLLASFKSYGQFLYDIARGENDSPITPFYEKEEVKSVGHRHTIDHDTDDPVEIKVIFLKLTELIARRLRAKRLVGRTVFCYFRYQLNYGLSEGFTGDGMQITIPETQDGMDIFNAAWKIFLQIWNGDRIRMVGATVSNLSPLVPQNLSFLEDKKREEVIFRTIDKINDKYGEFVIKRASVLNNTAHVYRKPNPYLSDRRFKL